MLRRRLLALVVLALLPPFGSEVVLASPASASAVVVNAPRVSTQLPIGTETLTLTGSIGRTVRRPVALQRHAGGRWQVVARRVVSRRGGYAFRTAMSAPSVSWRVVARPLTVHGRHWGRRVSRVRTVYRAIQTAYTSAVRAVKDGTPATVSLSFAPARPGRGASLQVDDGSGWRTVASLSQDRAGRASYRFTPGRAGMVRLRAVAAPFHGAGAVVGPAASLAVLRTTPVEVAAHRGASLRNPENTVPAIKNAVRLGADWLELDVRAIKADPDPDGDGPLTATPHFVLLHDPTFLRTTDIEQVFPARRADGTTSFTWPEVQRLDAGSWKGSRFAGTRVPDLTRALDAIDEVEQETGRRVRVILEFKGGSAATMRALYEQVRAQRPGWVSATGHDDEVVFMSFDYATVFDELRTGVHALDGIELAGVMDSTADPTYDWLAQMHVSTRIATAGTLERVHAAGSQAAVWTVDSPGSILAAATAGADLVTTDDVQTARTVLLR